ncbi:MAG TPA: ABC transporter permease subunit/CPBP intramembrane protease [Gemmataceae bacterium]|nr:ABC transporter permease subunit/CPBP intramembrane protease [Gemmataceae bacterium]
MRTPFLPPHVGLLRRLARKELSEILRDRRTILTLVLMPLLLYPLLAVAFRTFLLSGTTSPGPTIYRIGVHSGEEGESIQRYLLMGQDATEQRQARTTNDSTQQPAPELRWLDAEDLENAVLGNLVDVGIQPRPPGPFDERVRHGEVVDWELLYRDDSFSGRDAARYLESVCLAANTRLLTARLYRRVSPERETPVRPRPIALPNPQPRKSTLLSGLVPLILILMTITGAVYPAIDVTAGERERGTLEILVAAPVPRLSVLFAKYVAVFTVAMLTALVNLGTMTATLYLSGVGEVLFGAEGLSPLVFVQVLALLLLFAAFFSAVLLALTSFARSFKEAQAYLVPLMLLALMPGVLSLLPGLQLQGPLAITPLLNIALLTRDLLEGSARPVIAIVVVAATLLYALAALGVAARVFGAEAVLYSQSGGWTDLFRRPPGERTAATPSSALLCVALLFPSSFVIHGLLVRLGDQSIGEALVGMALANVLLFGGYPLVAVWWGRVRLSSGLRLTRPSVPACLAAVLLGLCLWPWAHEIALALRNVGIASLRGEHLDRVQGMLKQWELLSPLFLLLVIAVLPAVLEELFFRGYLFSALLGVLRPWPTILIAAALFALFHLILAGVLAVERFLPSLLLGIVLGWVCWKTGSLWPGMLLHALNNGCVVLLGYYQSRLVESGWLASGQEHLPITWLTIAALGSVVGILWMGRMGPGRYDKPTA